MKIICFKGKGNSGKSTVIKKIINEFFKIKIYPDKKDYRLILEYNGLRIGICSPGDVKEDLEKCIRKLIKEGCDIIICACHTRGKTLDYINSLVKNPEFIECKRTPIHRQKAGDNERISLFKSKFRKYF